MCFLAGNFRLCQQLGLNFLTLHVAIVRKYPPVLWDYLARKQVAEMLADGEIFDLVAHEHMLCSHHNTKPHHALQNRPELMCPLCWGCESPISAHLGAMPNLSINRTIAGGLRFSAHRYFLCAGNFRLCCS
jgi:hypothetical protein